MLHAEVVSASLGYNQCQLAAKLVTTDWIYKKHLCMLVCITAPIFSSRIHIPATAPNFPVAVFEFQLAELFINHLAPLALQAPHTTENTQLRRYFQRHVAPVRATPGFETLYRLLFTAFS